MTGSLEKQLSKAFPGHSSKPKTAIFQLDRKKRKHEKSCELRCKGHGTLNEIYSAVADQCVARGWDTVDLVVIGGDFQAARNANDLSAMAMPAKYRTMGDFHEYYSGKRTAPYLTVYVGGNHEASNYHWELPYGGWVAPNIYYYGHANVLQLGGIRIAGLSGIWKGYSYRMRRFERPPYLNGEERSTYHQRETDVRKLLQLREQVDVMLSHDWPRGVEWKGDWRRLFRCKKHFEQESRDGTLGSVAGKILLDRLRPKEWFSAHMHVHFEAMVEHAANPSVEVLDAKDGEKVNEDEIEIDLDDETSGANVGAGHDSQQKLANPDEIDLDLDDGDGNDEARPASVTVGTTSPHDSGAGKVEIDENSNASTLPSNSQNQPTSSVPDSLRAQLPASFTRPGSDTQNQGTSTSSSQTPRQNNHFANQPLPPGITNRVTHFLALDKCLPGRQFLSLLTVPTTREIDPRGLKLEYDPEWLAITRALGPEFDLPSPTTNPGDVAVSPDQGISGYAAAVAESREWIDENVIPAGDQHHSSRAKIEVPDSFCRTAPTYEEEQSGNADGDEDGKNAGYQNPQTKAFCDMLAIPNPCEAPAPVRSARRNRDGEGEGEGHGHEHGGHRQDRRFQSGWRGGRGRGGGGGAGWGRDGGRGRGGGGGGGGGGRGRGRGGRGARGYGNHPGSRGPNAF